MSSTRTILVFLALFLLACRGSAETEGTAFDRAARAAGNGDFRKAAELFAAAASDDPDRERREQATIRLANLEWRGFRKHAVARERLRNLDTAAAHLELSRIAADLGDFPTARVEAKKGLAAATKKRERTGATTALARVVVRDPRSSAAELREAVASLRGVIAATGPRLEPARLLSRAALRSGDGAAAMEGIDGYYHVSRFSGPPHGIAAAHAVLARLLPSWKGTDPERPEIARALAGIRFFDEAAVVSPGGEIGDYAATLRRVEALTNEYYRHIANGDEDDDELRDGIKREIGKREKRLTERFGLYVGIGKTGSHVDLHMGHVVADQTLPVEQYGRRASTRFVALDGIVSNGFSEWANDGGSGDGGWGTATSIHQVRPRYADGPLKKWERIMDEEQRAEDDRKIAEESARDRERAKKNPIQYFPGLASRLERQYLDGVVTELRGKGLSDEALRDAFLARVETDEFTSSILRHEGRHAIDLASGKRYAIWELEYRAKLSEIALAPSPREALASVLDNDIGGEGTHAKANGKLARELVAWMQSQQAEIAEYDPAVPPLLQLDRLTDEQIRVAVRSLDPLAK